MITEEDLKAFADDQGEWWAQPVAHQPSTLQLAGNQLANMITFH